MKKKRRIGIVIFGDVLLVTILFGIYVSDYYHVQDRSYLQETQVAIERNKHYISYGNPDSEVGLIFYPGGKVETESYEPLLVPLAEQGYFCVLMDMPFHLAIFDIDAADQVYDDFPEVDTWYLAGHSLGGAMGSEYAYEHMDQIAGLILLAAYPTKEFPEDYAICTMYGSEDQVLNMEHYREGKEKNPCLEEYVIQGGNHGNFGNYGFQDGDGEAAISREEQWNMAVIHMAAFMKK